MLTRLIGGAVLVLGAVAAWTQISSAAAPDPRALPMQFMLQQEGPAASCGDHCRKWVSAVGAITAETATDFAAFTRKHDVQGALVVLDSSGGSVHGTLELGRAIRHLGMTTTVGKTQLLTEGADKGRATLSPGAYCESMCVFLLLSGKQRFVPAQAQVMVHEIWLGDRRDDAAAATYSAEDLVIVQRDIGMLAQYTIEMGGSIDLLETALRIPPWEPLRKLSSAEIHRMGLDNVAVLPDKGSQAMAIPAPVREFPRLTPAARGWTVSDTRGQPMLQRQHPLTIEGDEIGSFDVAFACTSAGDSYDVTYSERRRGSDAHPIGEPLRQVTIALGRRSFPLKIVSSEVRGADNDLESVARGTVPASAIEILAKSGSRSITVMTGTGNDFETVTRIGNTGVAQNLPRLASGCKPATARVETRAELQPAQAAAAAGVVPGK